MRIAALDENLRAGVRIWMIKSFSALLITAAILFISAGRLNWVWGWVMVGAYVVWQTANVYFLLTRSPDLLAERSKVQKGTKKWDVVIASLAASLLPIIVWLVAGLDERFGWSPALSPWLQGAMLFPMTLGYGFTLWAMLSNRFFSATVRIQTERGHTVQTGGPYRYMRHPGYVGAIVFQLASPLLLGSLWGLIPAGLVALLYIVRTVLEDRTLQQELAGYAEYAQRVRYRLVPGVW